MKILYLASSGASDPTRASIPLHVAVNGSVVEGQECAVAFLGDGTELVEEDLGQFPVVVLPGVDDHLVDPGVAQRERHGTGLDELRTVADDRQNLHECEATMAAASGR